MTATATQSICAAVGSGRKKLAAVLVAAAMVAATLAVDSPPAAASAATAATPRATSSAPARGLVEAAVADSGGSRWTGVSPARLRGFSARLAPRPAAARAPVNRPADLARGITAPSDGTFVGITPARLLDSRPGHLTVDGQDAGGGPLTAGQTWDVQASGRGGVPLTATAVVLNITVTGATASTFITAFPGLSLRPTTSNVNVLPGQTVAVAATVGFGVALSSFGSRPNAQVSFYNAHGSTQLIVDVTGYYLGSDPSPGGTFHPQTPVRVLDTRAPGFTAIRGGYYDWIDLSIPQTSAVAVNITVTAPTRSGFVSVWPGSGPNAPATSTVNFAAGQTVANMAVVAAAPDPNSHPAGAPAFSVGVGSAGSAQVIVDVVGWYSTDLAIDGGGLRFHAMTPLRIVDTRIGVGLAHPLGQGVAGTVTAAAAVGDIDTRALAANPTALADPATTYLSVYPGPAVPTTSSLNVAPSSTASNMVMTGLAAGGRTFGVRNAFGTVQAIVDVFGYFDAPPVASVSLVTDLSTVAFDQPLTLTATVGAAGGPTPAGTVAFVDSDNGVTLAVAPLAAGGAQIVTAALTAGTHHLRARYVPAGLFVPGDSASATVTVTAAASADATTYQQDPAHDGDALGATITASLHQAWQSATPANSTFLYPVIGGGRVFGVTADPSHSVSAFDLATGAALWGPNAASVPTLSRTIAYDGQHLFAVSEEGLLTAYDAATGNVTWTVQLGDGIGGGFAAAPTASDGVLYIDGSQGQQLLYAVSEVDGSVLWTAFPDGGFYDEVSVTVGPSGLYFGYPCAKQDAYTFGGASQWGFQGGSCTGNVVTAPWHGGFLYVRQSPTPAVVDTATGQTVGTFAPTDCPRSTAPTATTSAPERWRPSPRPAPTFGTSPATAPWCRRRWRRARWCSSPRASTCTPSTRLPGRWCGPSLASTSSPQEKAQASSSPGWRWSGTR